jgi:hypothetical protein
MPPIPSPFAQANVFYDLEGMGLDDAQVVFGLAAADYSATTAEAVFDMYTDNFGPVLANSHLITRLELRDSGNIVTTSTGAAVTGTGGSPSVSPQVAYLIEKRTALGGRRNRGRMYLPGPTEGTVDGRGNVTSARVNDLQVAIDGFLADLGAADMTMRILHADGGTPTQVTAGVAKALVATQRRRLKRN